MSLVSHVFREIKKEPEKKRDTLVYGCKCECSGTPFDRIFIALMNTFLPAFFTR